MSESHRILSAYQSLVQEHSARFDPQIHQLQQVVAQRLQEMRNQEQELIEAQVVELRQITQALQSDARYLLPSSEFQEFVQQLKTASTPRWYSTTELIVADEPTSWLLARLDMPLGLNNYRTIEDNYAYNDERTFTQYLYSLSIRFGTTEKTIQIETGRYYYPEPPTISSIREQQLDIEDCVAELTEAGNWEQSEREQLQQEMSCLICHASTLFVLTPKRIKFEYIQPTLEEQ